MRFPVVVMMVLGLALVQGAALAEGFNPCSDQNVARYVQPDLTAARGLTVLTLSPLYLEIKGVIERSHDQVQSLLKELAVTTDPVMADELVSRIERAEFEQQICILKIQVKYARQAGMHDLAQSLQGQIVDLLEQDLQVAGLQKDR